MTTDDTYNGWTNRETWAVALHVNNDQGWQESVHEALRGARVEVGALRAHDAGEVVHGNVEEVLDSISDHDTSSPALLMAAREIGSVWRVNWTELGEAFLEDLD